MNRGGALFFLTAIIIAGLLTWLNNRWLTLKDFQFSQTEKKIDYYLSDFTLLNTYPNGEMRYRVQGQHLIHQQQSGGSEIFKPLLQARDIDGTLLSITSEKAQQLKKGGNILLSGDVKVVKKSDSIKESFSLETKDLNYNPENKTLSSDKPVNLQSYSGMIKGNGFYTKLDEQELRIRSNVHIEYQPTR